MTHRTALGLVLAAVLGTSTPLVAETTYLPGAAELAGLQGARFSSTLELTNPGDAAATATIGLVPMVGKTPPAPITRTLAAGESVRIEATLKTLFGLAEDGAGTITVLSDAALLASLTTRNVAAAEGAYGLGLSAVPEAELLGTGETGHSIWVSHSADPKAGYRTNLSVTLVDPGTIVVVRVFDADGRLAGETTLSVQTPQVWQQPVTAIAGESALPVGRAEFEVKAGRATAYAVVNDNVTSDAIALQSERVPPGATERLVSGAAYSPGHLGAFWVTDLRIFNPGAEPVVATIRSLGAPTASSVPLPIPARGVVEVPRVLAFLGFPERTASALRVSADAPLLVAARTNNVDPAGVRKGTFSAQQFVSAWPTGLLGAGATGYFTGIDQTLNVPGTRTNLALVGGPEGAAGALVLRDERGAEQGRAPFQRAPGEWGQLGVADWFASSLASATSRDGLSLATVPPNSRIDVTVEQGALDAYVSQIDNGSGDAVTRPFGLPGGGDCSKVAILTLEATPLPVIPGVETTLSWTLAIDPPTAKLTSQSIRIGAGPELELDKDARSYTTSFPQAGPVGVTLTVRKGSCVKTRTLQVVVCGELVVEPDAIPAATVGEPFEGVAFTAPAGQPPLAFSISEGALPAGLVLASTGLLEGTPSEAGAASFTVAVLDANGCTGERAYRIEVGCPPMSIAPAGLPAGTVGAPYPTVALTVTGGSGSGTFAGRRLPPGLTVSSSGRIEGTPTEAGQFDVEITYRDANGCDVTVARPILVCNPIGVTATLPAATAGVAIAPTTFTASGAVGPTTFAVTAGALPAGVTFDGATGVLSGTPTVVGTFPFSVTATDSLGCTGTLATTLTVSCPTITISPASLSNGTAGVAYGPATLTQTGGVGVVTYAVTTGALPAGLTLTSAGLLSGTPTVTGTFSFTVTATDANACTGTQSYTLVVECPVITVSPASLSNGTAGAAYGPVTLTQAGGVGAVTYAVTAGALPAGITLTTAGVLSGTPTVTGTFNFTVTATDANGCTGTRALTLVVECPVITVSPASLSNATAGTAYGPVTLTQTGGVGAVTYAVTAGAMPTGVSLTTAGVLTGTPTVTGTFSFTVTATDANGCTGTRAYTLVVECPVITVTPATLPGGTTGIAYSQSVGSTGGVGASTYTIGLGALPAGLLLDGATGAITGTPTAAGTFNFTVVATDGNGCMGSQAYTVVIVCPTITVGPGALANGTVGTAYGQTVLGAGGGGAYLYAVTAGTLPAGLSLDGASGAITGTPTTADLFSFTITATDQYGCSGATAYQVRICPVIEVTPATAAQGTIGQVYAGTTFAQTGGVLPIGWSATGLPAGLALDAATGALTGTPTEAGGFAVVVTATDANGCTGSVAFTLRICPEMAIDAPASLAAGTVGTAYGPVTFTQTGSAAAITWSATGLPTGLTLDPTTGTLTGTPGEPGSFTVVVTATDANGCAVSRSYPLAISCPTITLSPGALPGATAGTVYGQTISASSALAGGTYSFSILSGALPAGLTLNPATGEISGTPTAVGTFGFTIQATHDLTGCTGDQAYTLVVACATITVGGAAPPTNVTAGVAGYTHTFTATGGVSPRTFSATGTLPTGLTLNPTTGVLSGTPTAAGTFDFTIVATDSATGATCSGSAPFSVTVVCPTITVSPTTLPGGIVGTAYSDTVTAAGGAGPNTFAVTAGALPTGLTLGTDGAITGTPSADGEFTFTITATDSATSCTGSRAYTVRICPVIGLSAVPACVTVGSTYTTTITPSAGTAPFTFGVTGTLPTGTTLDAGTGVLSGPLSAAGSFSFSVTVTDVNGCTGSQSYTVNVLDMAPAAGALPEARWNVAYSQTVTASGGTGGFTYAVTAGALPTWLVLNASTGALTGTPSGADGTGSFSFTITATNTATTCTISRAYTLVSRPVIAADSYANGAGNTQYAAGGYAPAPTTPVVSSATNILANDGGPAGMTATLVGAPASGTLMLNADGSFLFTPSPGVGGTISFTYKVTSNGVDSATSATVSIVLAGEVWYVNSGAAAGGTGISSSPFNNLASADAASGVNDVVYVHTGAGQTPGSIMLEAGQTLWGQGAAFSLTGTGLTIPAVAKPSLSGSVVLGGSVITVSSLDIATSTGTGLWDNQAGGISGITVGNAVTVAATGFPAVDLTSVTASASGIAFTSLSSTNSAGKGVNLSGIGGALVSSATTVTNPTGVGIDLQATVGSVSLGNASSTNSGGTGVNLASNTGAVSFGSLTIAPDPGQRGLLATENTGTLSATGGSITTTNATAVEITHSSLTTPVGMSFATISANGGANGVLLTRVAGTFLAAGGSLQNATGADFEISYGTANVSYAGSISDDFGTLVSVANATGGTKTFSGSITDLDNGSGSGISLTSNTGATIVFQGGLVLSTGTSPAFTATGGGTVVVCDESPCGASGSNGTLVNKLTTTTATALNVANTTIGASNLEFQSISAGTAAAGPANGIVLNATGSSGGLKVKGTGSAGTGGTIQRATGHGVSLTSTEAVSLASMGITNNSGSGIGGTLVRGLVLDGCSITGNGDSAAADESGVNITELTGTVAGGARPTRFVNTTVSNNFEFEIQITNLTSSGSLDDFRLENCTVSSNGATGAHGNLVSFLNQSSAAGAMTLTVTGGSYAGAAPNTATGVMCDTSSTGGGDVTCNVSGATFTNNNVAVSVSSALAGDLAFNVANNIATGNRAHGLNLFVSANAVGTTSGTFAGNTVGTLGVAGSGSSLGFGIRVQNEGIATANPVRVVINNNVVQETSSFSLVNVNQGIFGQTSSTATNLTITNNTLRNSAARAIVVQQNNNTDADSAGRTCVDISGNAMSGIPGQVGDGTYIRLRRLDANSGGGDLFSVRQANLADLAAQNSITTAQLSVAGTMTYNGGACPQP